MTEPIGGFPSYTLCSRNSGNLQLEPERADANSIRGLSLRESPGAVQNLGAGSVEAHCINPALEDRQAVGSLAVAAAELNGDQTVLAFLRRDIVNCSGLRT